MASVLLPRDINAATVLLASLCASAGSLKGATSPNFDAMHG